MSEYCSVRIWQLKDGASAAELETLARDGIAEMYCWIPGVERFSLMCLAAQPETRYLTLVTFRDYSAYLSWRRVEDEGPDYWERFASVFMHWEQVARLVEEYHGDSFLLMELDRQEQAGKRT